MTQLEREANLAKAIQDVKEELVRAERKHPEWPGDRIHQAAIVGEEAGELLQAALQYQYEWGEITKVRHEAIQTAAMALRLLVSLDIPEKWEMPF